MKATMKNFKEHKELRFDVIQFDIKTMKRTFVSCGLNIIDATLEVQRNTKLGFVSAIIPHEESLRIIHWESENKSRITFEAIHQMANTVT